MGREPSSCTTIKGLRTCYPVLSLSSLFQVKTAVQNSLENTAFLIWWRSPESARLYEIKARQSLINHVA